MGFSDVKTVSINSRNYTIESTIHNFNRHEIRAQTNVGTNSALPTGYLGAQAAIYNANSGAVVASSDWIYTTETASSIFDCVSYYTSSGYYFSKGSAKIYNGKGYVVESSYQTPNYAPKDKDTTPDDASIRRNQSGEIYGSEFFLNQVGIQPDLILAQGNDGIMGYVRAEDWNCSVATPEEAVAFMAQGGSRTIPLYSSDGITTIGTFTFMASNPNT